MDQDNKHESQIQYLKLVVKNPKRFFFFRKCALSSVLTTLYYIENYKVDNH